MKVLRRRFVEDEMDDASVSRSRVFNRMESNYRHGPYFVHRSIERNESYESADQYAYYCTKFPKELVEISKEERLSLVLKKRRDGKKRKLSEMMIENDDSDKMHEKKPLKKIAAASELFDKKEIDAEKKTEEEMAYHNAVKRELGDDVADLVVEAKIKKEATTKSTTTLVVEDDAADDISDDDDVAPDDYDEAGQFVRMSDDDGVDEDDSLAEDGYS